MENVDGEGPIFDALVIAPAVLSRYFSDLGGLTNRLKMGNNMRIPITMAMYIRFARAVLLRFIYYMIRN